MAIKGFSWFRSSAAIAVCFFLGWNVIIITFVFSGSPRSDTKVVIEAVVPDQKRGAATGIESAVAAPVAAQAADEKALVRAQAEAQAQAQAQPKRFLNVELPSVQQMKRKNPWKEGATLKLLDVPGYGPYPEKVDRDECAILCEENQQCSAAVWRCDKSCYLKNPSPFFLVMPSSCSDVYNKGAYEPYKIYAQGRRNISGAFPSLSPTRSTVVVIVRCHQKLPWLKGLLERVRSESKDPVQVVLYEQCQAPAVKFHAGDGITIQHRQLLPLFGTSLILSAHLLVNFDLYTKKLFPKTIIVDSDRETLQLDENGHADSLEGSSSSPWVEWSFRDFVDVLTSSPMPLTVGSGMHLVATEGTSSELSARLQSFSELLTKNAGSQEPPWAPTGWHRCPAAASLKLAPLTPASRTAIVTYVSDASFLVSARVLIHSALQKGCQSDIIVATISKSRSLAAGIQDEFPTVRVIEWPYITPPKGSREHSRWRDNYSKLNLFNMVDYDAILYVDADILALQNPDEVFAHPVVQASNSPFIGAPDWGFWNGPPNAKLNGGVLFLRPQHRVFDCIMDLMMTVPPDEWWSVEAEQGFLRWFFGDSWTQLPFFFDAQKTVMTKLPQIWSVERTVLLHFVGVKPHKTWSAPDFLREYREENVRRALAQEDQIDDERDDFHTLSWNWRREFFLLAKFSAYMSLFVAYHNEEAYATADAWMSQMPDKDLYVPMALALPVAPNNFSTRELMPEVKDKAWQLQLGEFAQLLAMARATWYSKTWIGFTTYSERRKAAFREGVSVDWVKVETSLRDTEHTRKVLFWYGIYAGDYWEMMGVHHPNMQKAIILVLGKMGYDASGLKMPYNMFWPFGNYIMMPYKLLKEYVAFAEKFMARFRLQYPIGCPFRTMEKHTVNWQARCLGYVTERLVHIWAILTKVDFQFVVDDENVRYRAGCRSSPIHCFKETS